METAPLTNRRRFIILNKQQQDILAKGILEAVSIFPSKKKKCRLKVLDNKKITTTIYSISKRQKIIFYISHIPYTRD